ncbi:MAG: MarR family transcriptional regulator [Desulfobacterales bacterium]|nr:MarR family transcriptional regulator [Desulfobacterales bacterium]
MGNDEFLKLDNQLCFVLYACSRGLIRTYRPLLADLDITYPQYLVMLVLWEQDGVSVKALGDRLFLDSGTLTPLLKRMASSGLIARKRSATDERRVNIFLTAKGKALKQRAYAVPQTLLCHSGLTAEAFMGLKSDLESLLARIRTFDPEKDVCAGVSAAPSSRKQS